MGGALGAAGDARAGARRRERGGTACAVFCGARRGAGGVDNARDLIPGVGFVQADLESGERWPFAGQRFAAVVVTNYLHRPLFAQLEQAVDEGGALIYETFMAGNERYGRPSNPAYLLKPGELLRSFKALTVVAFEQGTVERPKQAAMQRVCALRGAAESARIAP